MERTYCVEIYRIDERLVAYMPKLDICERGYYSVDEVVCRVNNRLENARCFNPPASDTHDDWAHLSGKYPEENLVGLFMLDVEF